MDPFESLPRFGDPGNSLANTSSLDFADVGLETTDDLKWIELEFLDLAASKYGNSQGVGSFSDKDNSSICKTQFSDATIDSTSLLDTRPNCVSHDLPTQTFSSSQSQMVSVDLNSSGGTNSTTLTNNNLSNVSQSSDLASSSFLSEDAYFQNHEDISDDPFCTPSHPPRPLSNASALAPPVLLSCPLHPSSLSSLCHHGSGAKFTSSSIPYQQNQQQVNHLQQSTANFYNQPAVYQKPISTVFNPNESGSIFHSPPESSTLILNNSSSENNEKRAGPLVGGGINQQPTPYYYQFVGATGGGSSYNSSGAGGGSLYNSSVQQPQSMSAINAIPCSLYLEDIKRVPSCQSPSAASTLYWHYPTPPMPPPTNASSSFFSSTSMSPVVSESKDPNFNLNESAFRNESTVSATDNFMNSVFSPSIVDEEGEGDVTVFGGSNSSEGVGIQQQSVPTQTTRSRRYSHLDSKDVTFSFDDCNTSTSSCIAAMLTSSSESPVGSQRPGHTRLHCPPDFMSMLSSSCSVDPPSTSTVDSRQIVDDIVMMDCDNTSQQVNFGGGESSSTLSNDLMTPSTCHRKSNVVVRRKQMKLFSCSVEGCNKLFDRPSKLQRHMLVHDQVGKANLISMYRCGKCGKGFRSQYHLNRHSFTVHGTTPLNVKSRRCTSPYAHAKKRTVSVSSSVPGSGTDVTHVSVSSPTTQSQTWKRASFSSFDDSLTSPMLLALKEGAVGGERSDEPTVSVQDRINDVKMIDESAADRTFKCTYVGCDTTFDSVNSLKIHFKIHLENRSYLCHAPDCPWSFSTMTRLKRHERTCSYLITLREKLEAGKDGMRSCESEELSKTGRLQGVAVVNSPTRSASSSKLSSFNSDYILKYSSCHSSKEYRCEICSKCFTRSAHLKVHLLAHSACITTRIICPYANCKWECNRNVVSSCKLNASKRRASSVDLTLRENVVCEQTQQLQTHSSATAAKMVSQKTTSSSSVIMKNKTGSLDEDDASLVRALLDHIDTATHVNPNPLPTSMTPLYRQRGESSSSHSPTADHHYHSDPSEFDEIEPEGAPRTSASLKAGSSSITSGVRKGGRRGGGANKAREDGDNKCNSRYLRCFVSRSCRSRFSRPSDIVLHIEAFHPDELKLLQHSRKTSSSSSNGNSTDKSRSTNFTSDWKKTTFTPQLSEIPATNPATLHLLREKSDSVVANIDVSSHHPSVSSVVRTQPHAMFLRPTSPLLFHQVSGSSTKGADQEHTAPSRHSDSTSSSSKDARSISEEQTTDFPSVMDVIADHQQPSFAPQNTNEKIMSMSSSDESDRSPSSNQSSCILTQIISSIERQLRLSSGNAPSVDGASVVFDAPNSPKSLA